MLAVVEQRQCLTRSKMRHQVLLDRTTHGRGETKSPRNRHRHKRGIGERSEIDPDHAAGEVLGDCMSERLGQAGLSDDSGPVSVRSATASSSRSVRAVERSTSRPISPLRAMGRDPN
jgi:hypothetical protein